MVSRSSAIKRARKRHGSKAEANAANVNGALIVAGLIGLITGSMAHFVLALIVLVVGSIYAGNIR